MIPEELLCLFNLKFIFKEDCKYLALDITEMLCGKSGISFNIPTESSLMASILGCWDPVEICERVKRDCLFTGSVRAEAPLFTVPEIFLYSHCKRTLPYMDDLHFN